MTFYILILLFVLLLIIPVINGSSEIKFPLYEIKPKNCNFIPRVLNINFPIVFNDEVPDYDKIEVENIYNNRLNWEILQFRDYLFNDIYSIFYTSLHFLNELQKKTDIKKLKILFMDNYDKKIIVESLNFLFKINIEHGTDNKGSFDVLMNFYHFEPQKKDLVDMANTLIYDLNWINNIIDKGEFKYYITRIQGNIFQPVKENLPSGKICLMPFASYTGYPQFVIKSFSGGKSKLEDLQFISKKIWCFNVGVRNKMHGAGNFDTNYAIKALKPFKSEINKIFSKIGNLNFDMSDINKLNHCYYFQSSNLSLKKTIKIQPERKYKEFIFADNEINERGYFTIRRALILWENLDDKIKNKLVLNLENQVFDNSLIDALKTHLKFYLGPYDKKEYTVSEIREQEHIILDLNFDNTILNKLVYEILNECLPKILIEKPPRCIWVKNYECLIEGLEKLLPYTIIKVIGKSKWRKSTINYPLIISHSFYDNVKLFSEKEDIIYGM